LGATAELLKINEKKFKDHDAMVETVTTLGYKLIAKI